MLTLRIKRLVNVGVDVVLVNVVVMIVIIARLMMTLMTVKPPTFSNVRV